MSAQYAFANTDGSISYAQSTPVHKEARPSARTSTLANNTANDNSPSLRWLSRLLKRGWFHLHSLAFKIYTIPSTCAVYVSEKVSHSIGMRTPDSNAMEFTAKGHTNMVNTANSTNSPLVPKPRGSGNYYYYKYYYFHFSHGRCIHTPDFCEYVATAAGYMLGKTDSPFFLETHSITKGCVLEGGVAHWLGGPRYYDWQQCGRPDEPRFLRVQIFESWSLSRNQWDKINDALFFQQQQSAFYRSIGMRFSAAFSVIFFSALFACTLHVPPTILPYVERKHNTEDTLDFGLFEWPWESPDRYFFTMACCFPAVRWADTITMSGIGKGASFWILFFVWATWSLIACLPMMAIIFPLFLAYYRYKIRQILGERHLNLGAVATDIFTACLCPTLFIAQDARIVNDMGAVGKLVGVETSLEGARLSPDAPSYSSTDQP